FLTGCAATTTAFTSNTVQGDKSIAQMTLHLSPDLSTKLRETPMSQTTPEILEALKEFDTPSITNVVATYPESPLCLGLYNPWTMNWYTDQTIRPMYPELGPLVGYAVTCVYGLPDPNFKRLSFMDVLDALDAMPKPTVLVLQQDFPPEIAGKVGLAGGNMVSAMKAIGCVGLISNGPSRDIDEVREMGFQYMLSGITPGHGAQAVHAVNVPVSVAGMDVAPGELIHMDENGACKFPADKASKVLELVRALRDEEGDRIGKLQAATSAAELRAIFGGQSYAAGEEK
ncbi:MAG: RraA family protein, partial [Chloroflexota bacterium]